MPTEPATPPKAQTAFLVVLTADNKFEFVTELQGIAMDRKADIRDVTRACHEILDDVAAARAGVEVVNTQMAQLRRMQLAGGGPASPVSLDERLLRRQ